MDRSRYQVMRAILLLHRRTTIDRNVVKNDLMLWSEGRRDRPVNNWSSLSFVSVLSTAVDRNVNLLKVMPHILFPAECRVHRISELFVQEAIGDWVGA